MKKIKFLSVALLSSMAVFTSCDKNDGLGPNGISNEIYAEFSRLYPNATDVEWNSNGVYAIASFELNGSRAGSSADNTAWFELVSSKFVMDEHDIPFASLPQTVKDAFSNSKYASWTPDDDVDVLRRLDKGTDTFNMYVIEVEQGEQEYDLYFDETGLLVKEVPDAFGDNDFTDLLPSKPTETGNIYSFLNEKYPGYRVVDLDNEDGGVEVEFIYNKQKHEALFTMSNKWVHTKTDYDWDFSVLPDKAKTTIIAKHGEVNRQNYHDLDIEKYECADNSKNFFNVEVEDANGWEFEYNFDINGSEITKPDFSGELGNGGGLAVDAAIQKVLEEKYPGAVVLERDYDDGLLELEIRHDGIKKDVYFNGRNEWVYTEYELTSNQLPENLRKKLDNEYISNGYHFDEAEVREDSRGVIYEIELETYNGREIKLFWDKEGNEVRPY